MRLHQLLTSDDFLQIAKSGHNTSTGESQGPGSTAVVSAASSADQEHQMNTEMSKQVFEGGGSGLLVTQETGH